jgi:hypothetical protein
MNQKVGLLAPVPLYHLKSGMETCNQHGRVAFGSDKWELFHDLDKIRNGEKVQVLIYASMSDASFPLKATWQALYIRHCPSNAGYPPKDMCRPGTTQDDTGWAIFWEVEDLEEIPEGQQSLIASLSAYNKRTKFKANYRPEGPILINPTVL